MHTGKVCQLVLGMEIMNSQRLRQFFLHSCSVCSRCSSQRKISKEYINVHEYCASVAMLTRCLCIGAVKRMLLNWQNTFPLSVRLPFFNVILYAIVRWWGKRRQQSVLLKSQCTFCSFFPRSQQCFGFYVNRNTSHHESSQLRLIYV